MSHLIYDADGEKRIVEEADLIHPLNKPTPQQRADTFADQRLADIMEVAEALGLTINQSQVQANLRAIERRKRGIGGE